MTLVLGIDLSLNGCGLAGDGWADTITPPAPPKRDKTWRSMSDDERAQATLDYRHRRLQHVTGAIRDRYIATAPRLVVLEGMAYDAFDTDRQLAGLAWNVRHSLWRLGIAYACVPPSTLKQFATGKGDASKAQMVAAAKAEFPWFDGDDNAADALWLCSMGYVALGSPLIRPLPAWRAKTVAKCQWPDLEPYRAAEAVATTGGIA